MQVPEPAPPAPEPLPLGCLYLVGELVQRYSNAAKEWQNGVILEVALEPSYRATPDGGTFWAETGCVLVTSQRSSRWLSPKDAADPEKLRRARYQWIPVVRDRKLPSHTLRTSAGAFQFMTFVGRTGSGGATSEVACLVTSEDKKLTSVKSVGTEQACEALVLSLGVEASWVPAKRGAPLPEGAVNARSSREPPSYVGRVAGGYVCGVSLADGRIEGYWKSRARPLEEGEVLCIRQAACAVEADVLGGRGIKADAADYRMGDTTKKVARKVGSAVGLSFTNSSVYVRVEAFGASARTSVQNLTEHGDVYFGQGAGDDPQAAPDYLDGTAWSLAAASRRLADAAAAAAAGKAGASAAKLGASAIFSGASESGSIRGEFLGGESFYLPTCRVERPASEFTVTFTVWRRHRESISGDALIGSGVVNLAELQSEGEDNPHGCELQLPITKEDAGGAVSVLGQLALRLRARWGRPLALAAGAEGAGGERWPYPSVGLTSEEESQTLERCARLLQQCGAGADGAVIMVFAAGHQQEHDPLVDALDDEGLFYTFVPAGLKNSSTCRDQANQDLFRALLEVSSTCEAEATWAAEGLERLRRGLGAAAPPPARLRALEGQLRGGLWMLSSRGTIRNAACGILDEAPASWFDPERASEAHACAFWLATQPGPPSMGTLLQRLPGGAVRALRRDPRGEGKLVPRMMFWLL